MISFFSASAYSTKSLFLSLILVITLQLSTNDVYSQCPPQGNPDIYGVNHWIGYLYDSTNFTNYKGYTIENESFQWNKLLYASFDGTNICGNYYKDYSVRYRMIKNFASGIYTFTIGADDGYRLSVDGGQTWLISNWSDHWFTSSSASVYLNGSTNLVIEYYQNYWSAGLSFNYSLCAPISAPTSISGPSCNIGSAVTLIAQGATVPNGSVYQWGTGNIPGQNIIAGQSGATYTVNPSVATTYWVRVTNSSCSASTPAIFKTISRASTAPTTITGPATSCAGSTITLQASGGITGSNSVYQWGTGAVVGTNIISGATSAIISVNPTVNTTYWVRRKDESPCSTITSGVIFTANMTATSTAPTTIVGGGTSICAGTAITLTASGGNAITGTTYQWGTGTIAGSNVISGNSVSITVTPTTPTNYWVRRYDSNCNIFTSHISTAIMMNVAPGNPSVFGIGIWNAYGYTNGDLSLLTAVYKGYYTQNTLGFNSQSGLNSWLDTASPSSSAGWLGCSVASDNFTLVYKRKGFPCGTYTLKMERWDDSSELYIDGIKQWNCANWSGGSSCNGNVGQYNLGANSEIEVRIREISGLAGVELNITDSGIAPTPPTSVSVSGSGTICAGSPVILTANGGSNGTSGVFEWGTGNIIGQNIIVGQMNSSITVSPIVTTSYWVRRKNSVCGTSTTAKSNIVTVNEATVAGVLSTTATEICRNTTPASILLNGNIGNVLMWQSASNASFTNDITNIASTLTTLTGAQMGAISTTKYYRAVVKNLNCNTEYTNPIQITVPTTVIYANGIWTGTPSATTDMRVASNITLPANIEVCSCEITGTAILTIPNNTTLIVNKSMLVSPNAKLIIENNGSLVQIDNNNTNSGSITVKRNSTPMKLFDYTYWSAPVQNVTLAQLSPNTLFDKYFSYDALTANNWKLENATAEMLPSKGYIVRAPQGWSLTNSTNGVFTGVFIGKPNNGIIPVEIKKGAGTLNLIGNPYPSAIDIDLFLSDPTNAALFKGTIYLWTHNTPIAPVAGVVGLQYSAADYAKYNLTGSVKTATAALTGNIVPTGKIASGQSFFIEAKPTLATGTYNAVFNNSMRVAQNNDQFFRLSTPVEKDRLWLNLTNDSGAYNEILVGYVAGATNELDDLYDGKTFAAGNSVSLYTIVDNEQLSIQGRALPFIASEVIPMGFSVTTAGTFSIAIDNTEGVFTTQDVYLFDKQSNTSHNLKLGAYSFITAAGTFNERFEIRFITNSLATTEFDVADFSIAIQNNTININSGVSPMSAVTIYDLRGRLVFTSKVSSTLFSTPILNMNNEVLIVSVTFENGATESRKVLLN